MPSTFKKILPSLFALFAAALLFSSCSSKKKQTAPPATPAEEASGSTLNGTTWLLENLGSQTAKAGITVNFDKGQARGSAGCNSYSGPYFEGAKGKFRMELAVMTKNQCDPPEIMQQEQRFTDALKTTVSFSLTKDRLTLKDAKGGAVAVLKAQSQELRGTLWHVIRYNDGQGNMTDVLSSRSLTATFDASGQLSGFGGCNKYLAKHAASPSARTFNFEMIMMTTQQCPSDTLMEQEGSFMAALYMASSYRIEGDTLTLSDAEGNPAVIFKRN
jgi:heat shock protein HslJ